MKRNFKLKDKSKIHELVIMESLSGEIHDIVFDDDKSVVSWTMELCDFTKASRNGLTFTEKEIKTAIAAPIVQELLKRNALFCEDGHPDIVANKKALTSINRDKSCARIIDFIVTKEKAFGRFETLTRDRGISLKKDILNGVIPACSLRALRRGGQLIIITWDIVTIPSCRTAHGQMDDVSILKNNKVIKDNVSTILESFTDVSGNIRSSVNIESFADAQVVMEDGNSIENILESDGRLLLCEKGALEEFKTAKKNLNNIILEQLKEI